MLKEFTTSERERGGVIRNCVHGGALGARIQWRGRNGFRPFRQPSTKRRTSGECVLGGIQKKCLFDVQKNSTSDRPNAGSLVVLEMTPQVIKGSNRSRPLFQMMNTTERDTGSLYEPYFVPEKTKTAFSYICEPQGPPTEMDDVWVVQKKTTCRDHTIAKVAKKSCGKP